MTQEQIKQNAEEYYDKLGSITIGVENEPNSIVDAYIAGAHSLDDEIARLKAEIEDDNAVIRQLKAELAKAKNPWVSVEERLPKTSDWVLVRREVAYFVFRAYYKHHTWYADSSFGEFEIEPPTHWMPIPEGGNV